MALVKGHEPTPDQLTMLRTLVEAPRYLLIRARPWCPVKAILPVSARDGPALNHLLHDADQRGDHCQLVSYRPDEEDLGPFEPRSINSCAFLLLAALVACVAFAAYAFWRAFQ